MNILRIGPTEKLSSIDEVDTWKTNALKETGIVWRARLGAWTIALSRDAVVTDLHHFSASLTDPRSSTEADWQLLGQITSTVGTPADPMRPLAETPPGAAMHWSWRAPPPREAMS